MLPDGRDSFSPPKKKKKVDAEALNSSFMRIPGMKVEPSRALLDIGLREVYELTGRAPEVLYEEWMRTPSYEAKKEDVLPYFRMAVHYAENPDADPRSLSIHHWRE